MMTATVLITDINPTPWMAPEAGTVRRGNRTFPVLHSPAEMQTYKLAIQELWDEAFPEHQPDEGTPPVFPKGEQLYVGFYFWRKIDRYEKNGRQLVKKAADATNMTKVTEDALQKRLYFNDAHNRVSMGFIVEQHVDTEPAFMVIASQRFGNAIGDEHAAHSARLLVMDHGRCPAQPGNVWLRTEVHP